MITENNLYHSFRIALPDGRRIFLAYNRFTGPYFFYDKHFHRPITNWINDQGIIRTFWWFLHRGCKA